MKSWISYPEKSDFSIHNIPFGVFSNGGKTRLASAIGDKLIDLKAVADTGLFDEFDIDASIWESQFLNNFISLGKDITSKVRLKLQSSLCEEESILKNHDEVFLDRESADMLLPVEIGDYTDFYSSIEHATNLGKLFRDPENALLPNWRHLPVGYHGRSSSIVVSGVDIHRPKGQQKPADSDPVFGPCKLLDFELEMGFIIGKETKLGTAVNTAEADDYIFGKVLFNDWSARDIQKWEYVPLGPFLGKNFASSLSPWIVTLEALAPFQVAGPLQEPAVLPYLQYNGDKNIDINLEVIIQPEGGEENVVSESNFKYMYWNMAQQLAHHTVNGCNIKVGDLLASGTISGKDQHSYGSMLEISQGGKQSLTLKDGSERKFINDNDTVIMRGYAEKDGMRVGFGQVRTKVLPAL